MAKAAITNAKLIAGIVIAILATSAILVGIKTFLIAGPQGQEETQSETGATGPTGETGSTEPAEENRAADIPGPRKPQGIQVPHVPSYDSVWVDTIDKFSEYDFSIAWITDTQLNSKYDTWGNFAEYLVAVKDTYNIQMVVHTGDIIQNWWNLTQWEIANASMGKLLDCGVPYCWLAGNHDFNYSNKVFYGENYLAFNTASQANETYWLSSVDNRSTAVEFSYQGYDFIVVAIEWHAETDVMNWLTNIVENNPDKNILIAAHSYINGTGHYADQWGTEWNLALKYLCDANPNVFATINGHYTNSFRNELEGRCEMMADYMNTNFMVVTYLFFDVINEKVYVRTYQQTGAIWYTANAQNFSFDIELV